jgi:dextranase
MKKLISFLLLLNLIFFFIGCQSGEYLEAESVVFVTTDKSRYNPGDSVNFEISFNEANQFNGKIEIDIFQISQLVDTLTYEYSESDIQNNTLSIEWLPPEDDFKGYLAVINNINNNQIVDCDTIGIDISSDWSKFPRYGYLSDYSTMSSSEINLTIEYLNRYHINGLQFYDWQYKHHVPLKMVDEEASASWQNIANSYVYFQTVSSYIDAAHEYNMTAMNYNLIFGAYSNYEIEGLSSDWRLFKDLDQTNQDYHPLPSTWATSQLMLMNPQNEEWREYILQQEQIVFENLNFDGWHMDQLGYRGILYDSFGKRVNLDQTYGDFITYIDNEMDIDIIFNLVNDYGLLDILTSEELEFIYTEIWNLGSYSEIKNMIESYSNIADKNVVIAGYMNYELSDRPGEFNLPGVLLANATIFAAGGSHIELGDHGLLGNEYFPNDNLQMSESLEKRLIKYYDFLVAYQNCLRDNVGKGNLIVESDNFELTKTGSQDKVWYFSNTYDNKSIIHLINLLDNQSDWRDDYGNKSEPEIINDFIIKIYVDEDIIQVSLASPDFQSGIIQELEFTTNTDGSGKYIEVSVPYLEYWDMLILE